MVGVARTEMSDDSFRDLMIGAIPDAGPGWAEIVKNSSYIAGEYSHPDTFTALQARLKEIEEALAANTPELVALRQKSVETNTWDATVANVLEKLQAELSHRRES